MAGTSVIKQVITTDLRAELRSFIDSVNQAPNQTSQNQHVYKLELVRKGLNLLKNLPTSRDDVFKFFNSIYEKSLVDQLITIENCNAGVYSDDPIICEIHASLISFVTSSLNTWSLVISKWTLELLGMLTNKYSLRGRSPAEGSLGDSLNQWMSCQATRSLMDINIKCLSTVINTRNESTAIYNLLDNCIVYIPDLDWAVATVGGHYPYVLTKRVFTWGLQDFLANDGASNRPRMQSLGAILTHLTGCYSGEIQNVMTQLVKWSLDEESDYKDLTLDKGGAIPFLLQLATLSSSLFSVVSQGPLSTLKYNDLEKYLRFGDRWAKLAGGRQKLLEMTALFILTAEDSAQTILSLIIQCCQHENPVIKTVVEEICELMNKELDISVLGNNSQKVPFLLGLLKNINWLIPHLLSDVEEVLQLTTMLISLIGVHHTSVLSKSISYVLLRCKKEEQLVSVVRLSNGQTCSAVLSPAISQSLSICDNNNHQEYLDPKVFWTNLSILLKWEASGALVSLPMQEAIRDNMTSISERLCTTKEVEVARAIANVVKRTLVKVLTFSASKPLTVHQTLSLVQGTISYFYICLTQTDDVDQLKGMQLVTNIISQLCQNSNVAQTLVIRELLESALFRSPNVLFGATREPTTILTTSNVSLLDENYRQGTCSLLAQRHSVLHAGVIESYKRKYDSGTPISKDKVTHNTNLFISALRAACSSQSHRFVDSVISVALLLVELVSPDVMYNGLPWPEEEFCKVTVERDLYIRRMLDQVPLLWSLLSYIAYYRPALCYCSVILRALIATLISQWSLANQQGHGAGHCVKLIEVTSRILQIMTLGQLLPPPLSSISDALPALAPSQVVEVLKECVWNYMRYNVPSPALFTRDPNGAMWRDPATSRPAKQYTEPLRLAMLSNISLLGTLFNILFVPETADEE